MIAALYLLPILQSGLADDDLLLAHLSSVGPVDSIAPLHALVRVASRVQAIDGGTAPLRVVPLAFWFVTTSVSAAKELQLLLILCNFGTFALLARKLLKSNGAALLATGLTLTVWEIRYPHDPTLGSSFQWPWSAELVLLTIYSILNFADRGEAGWLVASVFLLLTAGLSNSSIYVVIALVPILAMVATPPTRRASITIPLTLAAVAIVGIQLASYQRDYAVWHFGTYVRTIFFEILAALPTTYRAMGNVAHDFPLDSFGDTRFQDIPNVTTIGWLAVMGATLATYVGLLSATRSTNGRSAFAVAVASIMLWIGPALVVRHEAIWSGGLPSGQAYGSVYLEQFGIGLLLAWLAMRVGRSRLGEGDVFAVALSLGTFLIIFGNIRTNAFAIERLGHADFTRALVDRSGADGFFAAIPVGSTIVIPSGSALFSPRYGSVDDARYALYHYSGRTFTTVSARAINDGRLCRSSTSTSCQASDNVYILGSAPAHLTEPQLSLAHWTGRRGGIDYSDRGYGFAAFANPDLAEGAITLLSSAQPGVSYDVAPNIEPSALAFIATRTCGPVPVPSVFKPTTPTIRWGAGFYSPTHIVDVSEDPIGNPPMRGSEPLFRWASRKAELLVTRSGCKPMDMKVTFAVDTSQPASIRATWPGGVVTARGGAHTLPILELKIGRTVKSPIHIEIETDAPPFPEQRLTIRQEGEAPQDRRMLVVQPAVEDELTVPLDQRLNPTGGLF